MLIDRELVEALSAKRLANRSSSRRPDRRNARARTGVRAVAEHLADRIYRGVPFKQVRRGDPA